jgi:predicted kinase
MQSLSLKLGSLILLSGPPGCGKSMACRQLPPSVVVSSDALRMNFFGVADVLVDGQTAQRPMAVDDRLVFSVMQQLVRSRLQVGLTTVVDATLATDKDRSQFAAIAEELDRAIQVIIFDLPEARIQQQNQARPCPVPAAVVSRFYERLERQSRWPFTVVQSGCSLSLEIPTIPAETKLDVIGDVHGLAEDLQKLLEQLGYDADLNHPEDRQLCFLGDLVDRGPDSLGVLDLVMAAVERGHYCIRGNHDANLARGLRGIPIKSRATRATLHDLLQREPAYREQVRSFINNLPTFYRFQDTILCHGDIEWFDPVIQPSREHVYGRCRVNESYDTDGVFRQTTALKLIRGHIPLTSPGERVEALEEGAGFGGPLVALRLPAGEKVRLPCAFNYLERPPSFAMQMESLVTKKLVRRVVSNCQQMQLYKYTSKAFFTPAAWQTHPELKLARGVVVGLNGEPVSRPFPRTFNYQEQDTTLPPETRVVAVEKLNGFLVTTFLHSYQPNDVVVTCSGSFAGDYVSMAQQLLYQQGLYGRVLAWLRDHPDMTLLWEAIHPDDPHIIPYGEDQSGLHLIGAGELTGGFLAESQLDALADSLAVPRPAWFTGTFQDALAKVRAVEHEGFMIRLEDGAFALKLKSPYYLRTKFLARMNPRKSQFMFNQPERFKQELDEELWPLVDLVTQRVTAAEWLAWSDIERRDLIQTWMDQLYGEA